MTSKSRFHKLLVNGLLLLVSTTLALLAVEACVRILRAGDIRDHRLLTTYHPVLGWVKIPNKTGVHSTSEYRITETMNSEGIRGPEYPRGKRIGEYRILILGDSFAEGYTVEFDDLFSEVLKRRLNARRDANTSYEVINTGTGGYSTDQELLLFQTIGKAYHPDMVILLFVDNDVFYNNSPTYPRGHKPLFRLEGDKIRLTNVPVPSPAAPPLATPQSRVPHHPLGRLKAWLSEHSRLYTHTVEQIRQVPALKRVAVTLRFMSPESDEADARVPRDFRLWKRAYDAPTREAWVITEALLRTLRDEAASVGSELIVVYTPLDVLVRAADWDAVKARYDLSDKEWNPRQGEAELRAICARLRVSFLSPVDRFREEAERLSKAGRRLYFARDGHWNAEGHRVAGEVLGAYLADRFRVPRKRDAARERFGRARIRLRDAIQART